MAIPPINTYTPGITTGFYPADSGDASHAEACAAYGDPQYKHDIQSYTA